MVVNKLWIIGLLVLSVLVITVSAETENETTKGAEEGEKVLYKFGRKLRAVLSPLPTGEFLIAEDLIAILNEGQTRGYHTIPVGSHPSRDTGNNDGVGNLRLSINGVVAKERSISAADLFGTHTDTKPSFSVLEQGNILHIFFFFPPSTGEIFITIEYVVRGAAKLGTASKWTDLLFGDGDRSTPETFLWNFITPALGSEQETQVSVQFDLPESEGNEYGVKQAGFQGLGANVIRNGVSSNARHTRTPYGKGWSYHFSFGTSRWEDVGISVDFLPEPAIAANFPMPRWQREQQNTALIATTLQMAVLVIIALPLLLAGYYKSPKVQTMFEINDVPHKDFRVYWIAYLTKQKIGPKDVVAHLVELERKKLIKWTDNKGGCALHPDEKKDVPLMIYDWKVLDAIKTHKFAALTPRILCKMASDVEPLIVKHLLTMKLMAYNPSKTTMKMDLLAVFYAIVFGLSYFYFADISQFLFPNRSSNLIKTLIVMLVFGVIECLMLRTRLSSLSNLGFEWKATWIKFFQMARSHYTPSNVQPSWLPFLLANYKAVDHWGSSPHLHPSVSFLLKACH